jgi:hypothetical protein
MQANPEVMRYLGTGRTSTPAEVWRTMATSVGTWAPRTKLAGGTAPARPPSGGL